MRGVVPPYLQGRVLPPEDEQHPTPPTHAPPHSLLQSYQSFTLLTPATTRSYQVGTTTTTSILNYIYHSTCLLPPVYLIPCNDLPTSCHRRTEFLLPRVYEPPKGVIYYHQFTSQCPPLYIPLTTTIHPTCQFTSRVPPVYIPLTTSLDPHTTSLHSPVAVPTPSGLICPPFPLCPGSREGAVRPSPGGCVGVKVGKGGSINCLRVCGRSVPGTRSSGLYKRETGGLCLLGLPQGI